MSPAEQGGKSLRATVWALRRPFGLAALLSGVANLMLLTPTVYLLQVYDRVLISRSELTLVAVSMVCVFLLGLMATAETLRTRLLVRAGLQLDTELATRLFDASFNARFAGEPGAPGRAFADLLQVRQFLTGPAMVALFDAPWVPLYVAVMFMLHPMLGALALAFACVQGALAWFGHRRTVGHTEAAAHAGIEASLFVKNKLRQAAVVETLGMLRPLMGRWQQLHQHALDRAAEQSASSSRVAAASRFVRHLQQSLALGVGALLVLRGELSLGAMIATALLMGRALAPIEQLTANWRAFSMARAAHARLDHLLQGFTSAEPAPEGAVPTGEVTLRKLVATAPGRADPLLKEIDLHVPAGTIVAVMGPSGAGKSTLGRVILGIWPDLAGEALLDGRAVSAWNRAELGPHLGYLPQDVQLLDGTIAENIARFGEIDSDKVIAAARQAGLHDMVLRLPQGYDTPLGDGGRLLSGGQRQRIALARAVYGAPSLLVLDEPNASLDDAGEAALARTLRLLKAQGSTVFLITQRPSIIAAADWLLLLHDGRISACGPRDALLESLRVRHPPVIGMGPAAPSAL